MKNLLKTIFKRLLLILTITIEILYAFSIGWWITILILGISIILWIFRYKKLYEKFLTNSKDDIPLYINILYGWFIMEFFIKLFKLDEFI